MAVLSSYGFPTEFCDPLELLCPFEQRCIPYNYACDGYVDCLLGIDEAFCPVPPSGCIEGDVRLQDGDDFGNGRVEVCIDGRFAPVCRQGWDVLEASLVCRQLELGFGEYNLLLLPYTLPQPVLPLCYSWTPSKGHPYTDAPSIELPRV